MMIVRNGMEPAPGESRPHTWSELTEAEKREAAFRGFARERGTVYFLKLGAGPRELQLSRFHTKRGA